MTLVDLSFGIQSWKILHCVPKTLKSHIKFLVGKKKKAMYANKWLGIINHMSHLNNTCFLKKTAGRRIFK